MSTEYGEGAFYRLYRERERLRLQDRALREYDEHQVLRPLCHGSLAHVSNCRCSCGGQYHGGRLPHFGSTDDD